MILIVPLNNNNFVILVNKNCY